MGEAGTRVSMDACMIASGMMTTWSGRGACSSDDFRCGRRAGVHMSAFCFDLTSQLPHKS